MRRGLPGHRGSRSTSGELSSARRGLVRPAVGSGPVRPTLWAGSSSQSSLRERWGYRIPPRPLCTSLDVFRGRGVRPFGCPRDAERFDSLHVRDCRKGSLAVGANVRYRPPDRRRRRDRACIYRGSALTGTSRAPSSVAEHPEYSTGGRGSDSHGARHRYGHV